jgi:acyl carrier protein
MSIEERVRRVIADQFSVGVEQVKNDASLKAEFESDSLDIVEITMAMEDEFGIQIPDDEVITMDTAQSFIDYVRTRGVSA